MITFPRYQVLPPVVDLPRIVVPVSENWSKAYRSARVAKGAWVPVQTFSTGKARNLAEVARKHGFDAATRGSVCFLRWWQERRSA